MPTLKSPSVARITRLTPFGSKFALGELIGLADALGARGAAAGAELVDRPPRIFALSLAGVGSSAVPALPA